MTDPLRYEHCLYATALVAAEGTRYVVTVDLPRSYDPSHLNALLAMEALLQLDPTPAAVEAWRAAFQRSKSPPAVRFTGPVEAVDYEEWPRLRTTLTAELRS